MANYRMVLLCLLLTLLVFQMGIGQDSSFIAGMKQMPVGYVRDVAGKAENVAGKIEHKAQKMLNDFAKQEQKLKRQLNRLDSNAAKNVFGMAERQLNDLKQKLQVPQKLAQYFPDLDSLKTSLLFIGKNSSLIGDADKLAKEVSEGMIIIDELEGKLQQAEMIKQFIKDQKQRLQEQLSSFGFVKQFQKINKHYHYYSQQINEYKEILKDRKKAERKGLELLSNTKQFKEFMKKNSMLAQMFRLPGGGGTEPDYSAYLSGLQTRNTINQLIQQQTGMSGANAQQQFQQTVQQGMSQMQGLKDKINELGSKYDAQDLPDFKPNDEKTKSFLKRLEPGTNLQFQKANSLFPNSADIGLSLGFKLSGKSIVGVGLAYQLGWGKDLRHIKIEHKGIGIRSFIDWKIKGGFWVSGGYEMNYHSLITKVDQLRELNAWQHSGLLGITKKFSMKSGFIKGSKVQILWDLMSGRQVPRTQPFLFRYGYNFQ